ncbi:MAG: hypothetical protein ACYTF7_07975 [Planctomycetota bacterium]|jgi:hypothetical protein
MAKRSLMHNLGSFFGHIARGITTPVDRQSKVEVRRETEERASLDPQGQDVTLRRTTIEEIEYTTPQTGSQHA